MRAFWNLRFVLWMTWYTNVGFKFAYLSAKTSDGVYATGTTPRNAVLDDVEGWYL